ncbi:hypothetical protein VPNG_01391 [Cytospora leucostoma]|uniref:F-box domain-containing protein n=1 Tax=Cytospora leucostoma TaxID=1230097 RepID=A0A423XLQ4_9PEZI|nr:hypothetical protein VPNG_01391 [Cytospora leucostoma]
MEATDTTKTQKSAHKVRHRDVECVYQGQDSSRRRYTPEYVRSLEEQLERLSAKHAAQAPGNSLTVKPGFSAHNDYRNLTSPSGASATSSSASTFQSRRGAGQEVTGINSHTRNVEFYGSSSSVALLSQVQRGGERSSVSSDAGGTEHSESDTAAAALLSNLHNPAFSLLPGPTPGFVTTPSDPTDAQSPIVEATNFRQCSVFLHNFFSTLHYIHPILDKTSFLERCELLWSGNEAAIRQQPSFVTLYYSVLSLGALVGYRDTEPVGGISNQKWSRRLFREARGRFTSFELVTDLETVQCYFFMAKVCQNELNAHWSYFYIGLAVRTALAMGINRQPRPNSRKSAAQLKAQARTWWGIYSLEELSNIREAIWMKRQKLVLNLRYLNLKILLFGSILLNFTPSQRTMVPGSYECIDFCLASAKKTIELMYETFRHQEFFRTWFYNTTYVIFAAATILVYINQAPSEVDIEPHLKLVSMAIEVLDAMADESIVASRSAKLLQKAMVREASLRHDKTSERLAVTLMSMTGSSTAASTASGSDSGGRGEAGGVAADAMLGPDGSEQEPDDDTESLDRFDEDHSYDPEVISAVDVDWNKTLHVLGSNPEATGTSKAFVSGPGYYLEWCSFNAEQGSDPSAEGFDLDSTILYQSWAADEEPVFPFHWCCFELLVRFCTGSFDVDKVDKDLLYGIMRELAPNDCRVLEDIEYGAAGYMQEQFWRTLAGYEFLVSNPRDAPGVDELVLSMFGSRSFEPLISNDDIGERVRSDPFSRLPYDLVYTISTMLEDGDLLNMANASWPVHALLRGVGQFWRQRLQSHMPWFFEMHEVLDRDQTLLHASDPKRIYLWAEKITRPKRWMTGPLMGVANRRRIWKVCEEIMDHQPRLESEDPAEEFVNETILNYSRCSSLVTVSAPEAVEADVAWTVYWIKSWSETDMKPKGVVTFWDGDVLVGISVAPYDVARGGPWQEQRLLGMDTSTHGVVLNTGRKLHFGITNRGFPQRILTAAPTWCITGITGMIGEVEGKQRFTRLGLLQAQLPNLVDYSILDLQTPIPPEPTPLQSLLWDGSYEDVLGDDIWNHPTLRLIHEPSHLGKPGNGVHGDLVPHEALIWARDGDDLRRLRRLSSYVVVENNRSTPASGGVNEGDILDVCGVNAEYTPESALMRRMVGINKSSRGSDMTSEDPWMHFTIDGPGGEIVTEVHYAMHDKLKAMKIRTNRERECYWGEMGVQKWYRLEPPPGETLVGLVMAFAEPSGYDNEKKTYAHCKMSFVGALSMPLGIPEESQTIGV